MSIRQLCAALVCSSTTTAGGRPPPACSYASSARPISLRLLLQGNAGESRRETSVGRINPRRKMTRKRPDKGMLLTAGLRKYAAAASRNVATAIPHSMPNTANEDQTTTNANSSVESRYCIVHSSLRPPVARAAGRGRRDRRRKNRHSLPGSVNIFAARHPPSGYFPQYTSFRPDTRETRQSAARFSGSEDKPSVWPTVRRGRRRGMAPAFDARLAEAGRSIPDVSPVYGVLSRRKHNGRNPVNGVDITVPTQKSTPPNPA